MICILKWGKKNQSLVSCYSMCISTSPTPQSSFFQAHLALSQHLFGAFGVCVSDSLQQCSSEASFGVSTIFQNTNK